MQYQHYYMSNAKHNDTFEFEKQADAIDRNTGRVQVQARSTSRILVHATSRHLSYKPPEVRHTAKPELLDVVYCRFGLVALNKSRHRGLCWRKR